MAPPPSTRHGGPHNRNSPEPGGTMELTRTETIDGMRNEYLAFADLIAPLDTAGWSAGSRCDGFEVRDVAGHVIGLAEDVVKGAPGSRTAEEEAADIRVLSAAQAAQRLRDAVAGLEPLAEALADETVWASPSPIEGMTLGEGVLTLWYDTFVHADDVRDALGRSRAEGPGLNASLLYLEGELGRRAWGPAQIVLTDQDGELAIGDVGADSPDYKVGGHDFVLIATGRADAAAAGFGADVNIYAD